MIDDSKPLQGYGLGRVLTFLAEVCIKDHKHENHHQKTN